MFNWVILRKKRKKRMNGRKCGEQAKGRESKRRVESPPPRPTPVSSTFTKYLHKIWSLKFV